MDIDGIEWGLLRAEMYVVARAKSKSTKPGLTVGLLVKSSEACRPRRVATATSSRRL